MPYSYAILAFIVQFNSPTVVGVGLCTGGRGESVRGPSPSQEDSVLLIVMKAGTCFFASLSVSFCKEQFQEDQICP